MTGASYQLTSSAEDELREILQYVADRDGVDRALHVHENFLETFRSIASMPGIGFTQPKLTGGLVRWRTIFKWLVIYDPEGTPTTILRVIHGARELERILGDDD